MKLVGERKLRKAINAGRVFRVCQSTGGCTRSGELSEAIMGGKPYTVERCAVCTVRSVVDNPGWR
jgi:hypothetical protein